MIGETVTVVTPGWTTDQYNNTFPDWTAATSVDVAGVAVAPRSAGDTGELRTAGRQGVITGLTVYLPAGVQVGPHDRVEVRGRMYEVEGEPGDWRSPFTSTAVGVEVALRRVDG